MCAGLQLCQQARSHGESGLSTTAKGRITDLVIDSIGLKVFGEGEGKVKKQGAENPLVWHKLHLAVDPVPHDIVTAEVSLENVKDAKVLPTLLNPLRRKLGRVYADGAYDSKGALEEDIGASPPLAGRDGNVSVQAVAGGKNQSA